MAGSAGAAFVPPRSPTARGSFKGARHWGQAMALAEIVCPQLVQGTFVAPSRASTYRPAST